MLTEDAGRRNFLLLSEVSETRNIFQSMDRGIEEKIDEFKTWKSKVANLSRVDLPRVTHSDLVDLITDITPPNFEYDESLCESSSSDTLNASNDDSSDNGGEGDTFTKSPLANLATEENIETDEGTGYVGMSCLFYRLCYCPKLSSLAALAI